MTDPGAAPGTPCDICRMQQAGPVAHWAWHRFCRAELNPVALYAYVTRAAHGEVGAQIGKHIAAVTGMDVFAIEQEIASWEKQK
jgi:hypothetical protein